MKKITYTEYMVEKNKANNQGLGLGEIFKKAYDKTPRAKRIKRIKIGMAIIPVVVLIAYLSGGDTAAYAFTVDGVENLRSSNPDLLEKFSSSVREVSNLGDTFKECRDIWEQSFLPSFYPKEVETLRSAFEGMNDIEILKAVFQRN